MDIRKYISDLLTAHDCVIIPGFGGFIGNYSPARIDPVHHTFCPPYKKLLFNINLKQNDGLLANSLVSNAGIAYADACLVIEEQVEHFRHDLKSGKALLIPEIGKLIMGREGNLQFEQDISVNLLPEAFGLTSFISPPVVRNSYKDRIEKKIPVLANQSAEKKWHIPRSLKWAAIVAIPVGVLTVIGLTQFDKLKTSQVSNAGILNSVFSRFSSTSLVEKKEAPQTPSEPQFQVESTPSIFDQPQGTDQDVPKETAQDVSSNTGIVTPNEKTAEQINKENHFAVIVGAFRIKENAEKLVAELKEKGIEAEIYDRSRNGLYRVTVATAGSRNEAGRLLEQAKSGEFQGAWLLEK